MLNNRLWAYKNGQNRDIKADISDLIFFLPVLRPYYLNLEM
jgi:hypothetical protein